MRQPPRDGRPAIDDAPRAGAGTARKYLRVVRYALAQWPALLAILVLTLALTALSALQPWPLKILVDYGLSGAPPAAPLRAALSALGLDPSPIDLVVLAALAGIAFFAASAAL